MNRAHTPVKSARSSVAARTATDNKNAETYGLSHHVSSQKMPAPALDYLPPRPTRTLPGIGLIGCGGISEQHLAGYKKSGFRVMALCDLMESRAVAMRDKYFPSARIYHNYRDLLERPEIAVADIALHPEERVQVIENAILAGKHVLSQKPFVLDLDEGRRLINLAREHGVKLAVNMNGRWAPHFCYLRRAVECGLLGDVFSVSANIQFNHSWIAGTHFEKVRHVILFDFGIHWFDMLRCMMPGREPQRVFASVSRAPSQKAKPGLLAQAVVEYADAQATLTFDGAAVYGLQDRTVLCGTLGTAVSAGTDLNSQKLTFETSKGHFAPKLKGAWFPDGFAGSMGELLRAIEEGREPYNSAENNLKSLALCFAAVASADRNEAVIPGSVRSLSE